MAHEKVVIGDESTHGHGRSSNFDLEVVCGYETTQTR